MSVITKEVDKMSNQIIFVPRAQSKVEIHLPDGRMEKFVMKSTRPIEFIFKTPQVQKNGDTTIDLEILRFDVETVSKVLWPGETVRMSGGRNITKEALPIYGKVTIPAGMTLSDGVESIQEVYLEIETPIGKLHNTQPIPMVGVIYDIPPIDVEFHSTQITGVYDNNLEMSAQLAGCGSATQM